MKNLRYYQIIVQLLRGDVCYFYQLPIRIRFALCPRNNCPQGRNFLLPAQAAKIASLLTKLRFGLFVKFYSALLIYDGSYGRWQLA